MEIRRAIIFLPHFVHYPVGSFSSIPISIYTKDDFLKKTKKQEQKIKDDQKLKKRICRARVFPNSYLPSHFVCRARDPKPSTSQHLQPLILHFAELAGPPFRLNGQEPQPGRSILRPRVF